MLCVKTFPIYRMFFDIDCCMHVAPVDVNAFYEKVSKLVCATILSCFRINSEHRFGPSFGYEPKTIKKSSKDVVKIGVHINVPELHVNKEMALRVRMAVVQKLENNFEKAGPTSWDDDVDHVRLRRERSENVVFEEAQSVAVRPASVTSAVDATELGI